MLQVSICLLLPRLVLLMYLWREKRVMSALEMEVRHGPTLVSNWNCWWRVVKLPPPLLLRSPTRLVMWCCKLLLRIVFKLLMLLVYWSRRLVMSLIFVLIRTFPSPTVQLLIVVRFHPLLVLVRNELVKLRVNEMGRVADIRNATG
ncbi:hypothetical protein KC19_VG023300 [Ceratodon purpureus]|uniref:Secreted protein n=1 Tax=Ceratodon purpureus TaxID=3225 RepID=A0A8T0HLA1_CERPU|nr:hypothetical protein KC19_VG023300 [Ceratodon purpureus]KAG0571573.1 hypothetical protein KC19_VG023300 [Ceratodon purpureus]